MFVYPIVGVMAAIATIAATTFGPSFVRNYYPQYPPGYPEGPLSIEIFISNVTEPQGIGSKFTVTIVATSNQNLSQATVDMNLTDVYSIGSPQYPIGFSYVEGYLANVTWSGSLETNVSEVFTATAIADEIGFGRIWVTISFTAPDGFIWNDTDSLWISVSQNGLDFSHEGPQPRPGAIVPTPSTLDVNSTEMP